MQTSRVGSRAEHARLERRCRRRGRIEELGGVCVVDERTCRGVHADLTCLGPSQQYNSIHVDSESCPHGPPRPAAETRTVDKHEISTPEFQKFIDDMIETMDEYSGVGLAAPQVHESLRVFVAIARPRGPRRRRCRSRSSIPRSRSSAIETVEGWEGCLSIPDIRGRVPRAQHIKVRALDRNGKRFELEASDFPRASSSTRPIISTACCSSIACAASSR